MASAQLKVPLSFLSAKIFQNQILLGIKEPHSPESVSIFLFSSKQIFCVIFGPTHAQMWLQYDDMNTSLVMRLMLNYLRKTKSCKRRIAFSKLDLKQTISFHIKKNFPLWQQVFFFTLFWFLVSIAMGMKWKCFFQQTYIWMC